MIVLYIKNRRRREREGEGEKGRKVEGDKERELHHSVVRKIFVLSVEVINDLNDKLKTI